MTDLIYKVLDDHRELQDGSGTIWQECRCGWKKQREHDGSGHLGHVADELEELFSDQRKATARAWSAFLDLFLDVEFDGYPLAVDVFAFNPSLQKRLGSIFND